MNKPRVPGLDWSQLILEGVGDEPRSKVWNRYLALLKNNLGLPVRNIKSLRQLVVKNWDREVSWPKGPVTRPDLAVDLCLNHPRQWGRLTPATRKAIGVYFASHPEYLEEIFTQIFLIEKNEGEGLGQAEPPSWDEMERRLERRKKEKATWTRLWFGRVAMGMGTLAITLRQAFSRNPTAAVLAAAAITAAVGTAVVLTQNSASTPIRLGYDLTPGTSFVQMKKGQVRIEHEGRVDERFEENTVTFTAGETTAAGTAMEGRFRSVQTPSGSTVSECIQEVAASFRMGRSGLMTVPWGQDQPSVRSIPTFPSHEVGPGSNWTLPGELYYYDLKPPLRLTVNVNYGYLSNAQMGGRSVAVLSVTYGSRKAFQDRGPLAGIGMTNEGTLYWDRENGSLRLYREKQDETLYLAAGGKQRFVMDFTTEGSKSEGVTQTKRRELQEGLSNQLHGNARVETYANAEGIHVRMKEVSFEFDSSKLSGPTLKDLDTIREVIKKTPGAEVRVSGHADSSGTTRYNERLSLDRARSVAEYLNREKDFSNLFVQGFGGSKPVADNRTEEGRRANRRVEINIRLPAAADR